MPTGTTSSTFYWPQGKIKEGEDAKSRKELYQANFSATGTGRYPKSLSQRRWKRLQKGKKYRLGLNTFGSVRTIKPPCPAAARPAATPQAPTTAPPSGGNGPNTTWSPADGSNSETD